MKKVWLKVGLILVCLVGLLLATFVIVYRGVEYKVSETSDLESMSIEPSGPYSPGIYSAIEKGYGRNITVTMTFDEEKITDIETIGENETQYVGTKTIKELAPLILEKQSSEIDTIKAAVKNCIEQATEGS